MKPHEVEKLVSTAREYLWPTFGRDSSFFGRPASVIESIDGRHFVDIYGNRLLETTSAAGACHLGFNIPEITDAMVRQTKKIGHATPGIFAPTEAVILLAEKISSLSPGSLQFTMFGCSGTDANDTAFKIARQYWRIMGKGNKYKVISRYPRGYHGMSLSTAAASGRTFFRSPFEPLPGGFIHIHMPNCYHCSFKLTYPDCNLLCAEELRQVVEFEDPSTIACFIGEQTVGGGGIIPPPPGYMKAIREICDEYEILLIVDEIVTGFGKTGFWFECEKYGIVPDMITMGKGLTCGCGPMSGVHVKREIAEIFTGVNVLKHGYSFGGMSYLAAVALAGIDYVQNNNLLARASQIGAKMLQELGTIKDRSSVIGDVRVNGVLAGVELVKNKDTRELFAEREVVANLITKAGIDNGVQLVCLTWYGNIIWLMIQLTMTDEELEMVFNTIDKAVKEVEKKFL